VEQKLAELRKSEELLRIRLEELEQLEQQWASSSNQEQLEDSSSHEQQMEDNASQSNQKQDSHTEQPESRGDSLSQTHQKTQMEQQQDGGGSSNSLVEEHVVEKGEEEVKKMTEKRISNESEQELKNQVSADSVYLLIVSKTANVVRQNRALNEKIKKLCKLRFVKKETENTL
jgi:cobalamin biosynthesis protein CobT